MSKVLCIYYNQSVERAIAQFFRCQILLRPLSGVYDTQLLLSLYMSRVISCFIGDCIDQCVFVIDPFPLFHTGSLHASRRWN